MVSVGIVFRGRCLRCFQTQRQLPCVGRSLAPGYPLEDATLQTADQLALPLHY
jgi:hypothetical protein